MKTIKTKFNKIPFKNSFGVALLTNFLMIILILALQGFLPPVVPLFYGQPQGEAQLARSIFLILPPAISFLITLANAFLSTLIKNKFLQTILLGLAVVVTVFSSVTVVKIILLVGSF